MENKAEAEYDDEDQEEDTSAFTSQQLQDDHKNI